MATDYTSIKVTTTNPNKGEGMLKVAFASSDMEWINDHFGKTSQFVIYDISDSGFNLIEVLKVAQEEISEEDDKNEQVAQILADKGVHILYVASIGPTAAAKVVKKRVHPLKVQVDTKVEDACKEFQRMLGSNPPPWIKKIINQGA